MTTRRIVRERIDPRLTAALFSNYRSPIDAILELVDNAVDSRVTGRPLDVDVAVHPGRLVVTAVGGSGMGPAAIERDYLRWGASSKQAGDRIGRFGQGGKAAVGHLGNRLEITASAAGDERAFCFEDPAYRDRARLRAYELHPRRKPVAPALGYVRIEIGEIDRATDPRRLRDRLAEVYRPLLEAEAVVMTVNRAPVTPRAWQLDERHDVAVRAAGRIVRGWWGLLPDPPPPAGPEGGVRLYHLGRLVGSPEWFGHPTPAAHPALNRLVGAVELPHVPVTMNKADVDRGSPAWVAVEARLHELLARAVRRLTREPASNVTPEAMRTADRVRRILARALRLLEEGRLFESDIPGGGEGPGGQLALDGVGRPPGEAGGEAAEPEGDGAGATAEPRTRPRQGGAGGGPGPGRRRGAAEVVVRRLDPRLRSALVEEDGVRRVVINSAYPLYEVRRGDLWYQLETALREVCVTIPEATVPEFERKVNELMLVSLALAERRRRPTARAARGRARQGAIWR